MPTLPSSGALGGAAAHARDLVRELAGLRAQRHVHRPRPPAAGLVLEVGGGQAPHPRSDAVVDKYVVDDFERAGEAKLSLARPLVVADGEALPFADGLFAYSIAQHVLEHATDPVRFARELQRVSTAGFVQVPSRDSELVYGWPYHPWLVELERAGLRFVPKQQPAPEGGPAMHEAFAESLFVRLGWAAHRSRWHHSVHWTGQLPVAVDGERRFHDQAVVDVERTVAVLSRNGHRPLPVAVRQGLRCPLCHTELRASAGRLVCAGCSRAFPHVGDVPVLVAEAAT